MKLKYLFEAELIDGTVYKQNKLDASVKFPPQPDENGELQGKSCVSDIQEDIDAHRIKRFTLVEQSIMGDKWAVDLTTGQFYHNDVIFEIEGDRPLPIGGSKFKLIYFRVRRDSYTTPAIYKNPKSVKKVGDGVEIVNSAGDTHVYEHVLNVWNEKEFDDVRFFILPKAPPDEPMRYMIGWQTIISRKTFTQKILVQ